MIFRGKTWIFIVQVLCLGSIGIFGAIAGPLFWSGVINDAQSAPRREAGPPLTIIGACLLIVAAMAVIKLIARRKPIIALYREGIECDLTGASPIGLRGGHIVGLLRITWLVLSRKGFRIARVRVAWQDIEHVWVEGPTVGRVLQIRGRFVGSNGDKQSIVAYHQAALKDHVELVAATINRLIQNPSDRVALEIWP